MLWGLSYVSSLQNGSVGACDFGCMCQTVQAGYHGDVLCGVANKRLLVIVLLRAERARALYAPTCMHCQPAPRPLPTSATERTDACAGCRDALDQLRTQKIIVCLACQPLFSVPPKECWNCASTCAAGACTG